LWLQESTQERTAGYLCCSQKIEEGPAHSAFEELQFIMAAMLAEIIYGMAERLERMQIVHVVEALLASAKAAGVEKEKELLLAADKKGRTGLIVATISGHVEIVEALLAAAKAAGMEKELLLAANERGRTALMYAVVGKVHIVEAMLAAAKAAGKDVVKELLLAADEDGLTALCRAVWTEVDMRDDAYLTPEVGADQVPIVEALLAAAKSAGEDVEKEQLLAVGNDPTDDNTALIYAARSNDAQIVQALLAAGKAAGVTVEKEQLLAAEADGYTALLWAAMHGDEEIVQALLAAGKAAGVEKEMLHTPVSEEYDDDGMSHTVLCWAAYKGHTRTLEMFLTAWNEAIKQMLGQHEEQQQLKQKFQEQLDASMGYVCSNTRRADVRQCLVRLVAAGASLPAGSSKEAKAVYESIARECAQKALVPDRVNEAVVGLAVEKRQRRS
jgi:ankyrin repeat protein